MVRQECRSFVAQAFAGANLDNAALPGVYTRLALYTDWMRKRELALADKARALQGQSGLPLYKLKVLTRYEDTLYMVAERTYDKPSPVPIPLTVLEAVLENGKWKLKIPREIIWDALESGRARTAEIERELKYQPYDVQVPLRPPVDTPLPAAAPSK